MRRSRQWLVAASLVGIAFGAALVTVRIDRAREQERWGMLESYCTECHNSLDLAGELSFEKLTPDAVPQHAEVFEAVVNKLRGRLMPPPGSPQPEQVKIDAMIAWLERSIDAGAQLHEVGYVPAQRLSRTEYASAVKDLLGVEIDPTEHLPAEIEVDGFTNIAAALSVSPAFIEQYVNVASTVAHLAVGEPVPKVAAAHFPPPAGNQEAYIDGMPLGTRGGLRFTHTFPADGEYRLTLSNLGAGLYPRSIETRHTLVVLVDRNEVFRGDIGGAEDLATIDRGGAPGRAEIMKRFTDIPMTVTAGTHRITVTFIERSRAASDEQISTFSPTDSFSYTGAPRVPGIFGGIDMTGPYSPTGLSPTPSRRKLFVCEPEVPERERECAVEITTNLARRAFRRPIDQSDLDRLLPFYEEGRSGPGGFDEGIELMTTAVLASPDFLYRSVAPRDAAGGDSYELSSFELASRLSFFLWSQGPDDELLKLAASGELARTAVLEAQVKRMLADPRAAVLVTNFALHWLNVDDLDAVQPDKLLFPEFTEGLREDFAAEIELFVAQRLARGPKRSDAADGRLHVLERAPRTPLRRRGSRRSAVSPRGARRRAASRTARQGRGAAAHVLRRPHVAGAARRLGARQAARHAADTAAARRRDQPYADRR